MNTKRFAPVVFLTILLVLLFSVGPVAAAEKTKFPTSEEWVEDLNEGTATFPNGNLHIRGMVQLYKVTAPDPRGTGYNTVTVNANWQLPDLIGPMWGTFSFETDEGGLWAGTWGGQKTACGPNYKASGVGYGIYAGMMIWVDMNCGMSTITILEH